MSPKIVGKTSSVQVVLVFAHQLQSWMVCSMHPSFLLPHWFHLLQPQVAVHIWTQRSCQSFLIVPLFYMCFVWLSNKCMPYCWVGSDSHFSLTWKLLDESITLGCPVAVLAQWSPWGVQTSMLCHQVTNCSCLTKGIDCFLKGRKQETDLLDCCFWLWHCYLVILK